MNQFAARFAGHLCIAIRLAGCARHYYGRRDHVQQKRDEIEFGLLLHTRQDLDTNASRAPLLSGHRVSDGIKTTTFILTQDEYAPTDLRFRS